MMKRFLKKLTGIAIVNFTFLLFATVILPLQRPSAAPRVVSTVGVSGGTQIAESTPAPVRNIFAELSSHNAKSSCWIGYKGHVYNITAVFGTHPGGDAIMLPYCGKDATVGFDTKGRTPAMPHSANAASLLAQYLVQ